MPETETQVTPTIADDEIVGFSAAKVRKRPGLACVGYISDVGELKDTEKGVYQYVSITVKGHNGSPGNKKNVFFRPDWFTPGFDAESLNEITELDPEDGKPLGPKMYGMYRQYIFSESDQSAIDNARPDDEGKVKARIDGTPAVLRGLCGSDVNFKAFCKKRQILYASVVASRGKVDAEGQPTAFTGQEVRDLLADFLLRDLEGTTIGYELKQQREKAGEDADGKPQYRLTDRMEIECFKFYDEVTVKGWERRAKAAAKKAENDGPGSVPSFKLGYSEE